MRQQKTHERKKHPLTPFVAQFKESYPPANSPLRGVKQTSWQQPHPAFCGFSKGNLKMRMIIRQKHMIQTMRVDEMGKHSTQTSKFPKKKSHLRWCGGSNSNFCCTYPPSHNHGSVENGPSFLMKPLVWSSTHFLLVGIVERKTTSLPFNCKKKTEIFRCIFRLAKVGHVQVMPCHFGIFCGRKHSNQSILIYPPPRMPVGNERFRLGSKKLKDVSCHPGGDWHVWVEGRSNR